MDFAFTEAQAELAGLARKILAEQESPWDDLAAAGVLAAGLPGDLGGAGLGLLEQCSVLVELGRAVSDAPYLASIVLGAGAIAAFGTAAQRERWAVPAGQGGDDPARPLARAERRAGGWVLSGMKTAVDWAPRAGLFLVPCSTPEGVRVFLVAPSDSGVTVEPQRLTDPAPAGRVVLDGVALDEDRMLGSRDDAGMDVAGWLADRATVGLCALQAGVAERALELTAQYARNRQQFGRPIGSFQGVKHQLADTSLALEMSKAVALAAARNVGADDGYGPESASAAKAFVADAGVDLVQTCFQIFGGIGYTWEHDQHLYLRRITTDAGLFGDAGWHRERLCQMAGV
jgi:alkylation response protein AidB-like acyl-CoA dehydrogenase